MAGLQAHHPIDGRVSPNRKDFPYKPCDAELTEPHQVNSQMTALMSTFLSPTLLNVST